MRRLIRHLKMKDELNDKLIRGKLTDNPNEADWRYHLGYSIGYNDGKITEIEDRIDELNDPNFTVEKVHEHYNMEKEL